MKKQLNWQTLQDRRDYNRLIMFYRIIHRHVALQIPAYLVQPLRLTRHQHPLSYLQIHTRVDYFKYSFYPYTVVLWNKLPASTVLQQNVDGFKGCLESSVLSHRCWILQTNALTFNCTFQLLYPVTLFKDFTFSLTSHCHSFKCTFILGVDKATGAFVCPLKEFDRTWWQRYKDMIKLNYCRSNKIYMYQIISLILHTNSSWII